MFSDLEMQATPAISGEHTHLSYTSEKINYLKMSAF